jgi:putative transposase
MRRTKAELYYHFVWSTYQRLPLVTLDIEARIYTNLVAEAERQGCHVLAIGGMPDHIHLLVKAPTRASPASLMQHIKAVSSTFVRKEVLVDQLFGWQDGYGVFSLSRSHKDKVIDYVRGQKAHHAAGKLWPEWEETDEEAPAPGQ